MKRKTEQRADIHEVFTSTERPLTAQEAFVRARLLRPRIGMATVYRAINALVEERWLHSVELPGEPARYERANKGHHHHFQCDCCRRVFDVPGCGGVDLSHLPTGFQVVRHEVVLYGTCADCQKLCGQTSTSAVDPHHGHDHAHGDCHAHNHASIPARTGEHSTCAVDTSIG